MLGTRANDHTYLRQKIERNWQADFRPFSSLAEVDGKERERNPVTQVSSTKYMRPKAVCLERRHPDFLQALSGSGCSGLVKSPLRKRNSV